MLSMELRQHRSVPRPQQRQRPVLVQENVQPMALVNKAKDQDFLVKNLVSPAVSTTVA